MMSHTVVLIHLFQDFFFFFFLVWTIFKVFIEFVYNISSGLYLGFWPKGMWDLSSLTRGQTCTLYIGRQILKHWTTREVHFCQHMGLYE